jgi:histidinol-phosphate aminotransferase
VAPIEIERRLGQSFLARVGANENPFGCSPLVSEALERAQRSVCHYPDPKCHELRSALSASCGVELDEVLVASGIDELLGLTTRAFLNPGDATVSTQGSYPTFGYCVRAAGGRVQEVPYADERPDLDGLARAAEQHRAKMVYIANPDNPSGAYHERASIDGLARALPSGTLLLVDRAYGEFAPDGGRAEPPRPNVLALHTFSKAHGLASLRVGYAIGPRELLAVFEKVRLHFGVSSFAQAAAVAALGDPGFTREVVRRTKLGLRDYQALAGELGVRTLPSATNFCLMDAGSAEGSEQLLSALEMRRIFVRRPACAPLNRFIRVSVGAPHEQERFAQAMRELVGMSAKAPRPISA